MALARLQADADVSPVVQALATLQRAADRSAPIQRPPGISDRGVIQCWPPNSLNEAKREIQEIESELFGKNIILDMIRSRRNSSNSAGTPLDKMKKIAIKSVANFDNFQVLSAGSSGLDERAILDKLKQYKELLHWQATEEAKSRGFGYPSVPTIHFPPPGVFEQGYSFNPMAPDMHERSLGSAPEGWTAERLGDDRVLRERTPEDLQEDRDGSNAYRTPSRKRKREPNLEPSFPPEVYSGQSTVLNKDQLHRWKHEKRGQTAHVGPYQGAKWPDQKKVMGMSAQQAVKSAIDQGVMGLHQDKPYEWLHLFAFSMGGQDNYNPQDSRNFVIGSQYANFYHLIFERLAKELATDHGLTIEVRATPMDPISEDWRIYRSILYSFTVIRILPGTFDNPEPVKARGATTLRQIPCLETPQVHASDTDAFRHEIFKDLGIITPEYAKAMDESLGPSIPPLDTTEEAMLQRLMDVNNCLIHAVARGGLGRNATFEELVTIRNQVRERGFPIGSMLVASPTILAIIRNALGIANPIVVFYKEGHNPDYVHGVGACITIDHAHAHFEERQPAPESVEVDDPIEAIDEFMLEDRGKSSESDFSYMENDEEDYSFYMESDDGGYSSYPENDEKPESGSISREEPINQSTVKDRDGET